MLFRFSVFEMAVLACLLLLLAASGCRCASLTQKENDLQKTQGNPSLNEAFKQSILKATELLKQPILTEMSHLFDQLEASKNSLLPGSYTALSKRLAEINTKDGANYLVIARELQEISQSLETQLLTNSIPLKQLPAASEKIKKLMKKLENLSPQTTTSKSTPENVKNDMLERMIANLERLFKEIQNKDSLPNYRKEIVIYMMKDYCEALLKAEQQPSSQYQEIEEKMLAGTPTEAQLANDAKTMFSLNSLVSPGYNFLTKNSIAWGVEAKGFIAAFSALTQGERLSNQKRHDAETAVAAFRAAITKSKTCRSGYYSLIADRFTALLADQKTTDPQIDAALSDLEEEKRKLDSLC